MLHRKKQHLPSRKKTPFTALYFNARNSHGEQQERKEFILFSLESEPCAACIYICIEVKTKMSALRTRDLTRGMSAREKNSSHRGRFDIKNDSIVDLLVARIRVTSLLIFDCARRPQLIRTARKVNFNSN
jgi:hypothetical protein